MSTSLTKRQRFDIFKRDAFTCQYCGRTPPAVVLEVDHVIPLSRGGPTEDFNLMTACFDCNRGKGPIPLGTVPLPVAERQKLLAERLEQTKALNRLLAKEKRRLEGDVEAVTVIFAAAFPGWEIEKSGRDSIRRFLRSLPAEVVAEAMEMACRRVKVNSAFRYFCGVGWRKIKGGSGEQQ